MKELAVQLSAFGGGGGGRREREGEWGQRVGCVGVAGGRAVGWVVSFSSFFFFSSPFPAMFASFGRNSRFAFLYSALDLEMFPFSLDRSA